MPQENESQQNNASSSQLFNQALALQQQKKWDSALEAYQNFLNKGQLSVLEAASGYYNMSAIAYEKGDNLNKKSVLELSFFYKSPNPLLQQENRSYNFDI